jgi:hypothetical protein
MKFLELAWLHQFSESSFSRQCSHVFVGIGCKHDLEILFLICFDEANQIFNH